MQFIYPTDPMSTNLVDGHFRPQANELLKRYGYTALFSLEEERVAHVKTGETLVYRGWMLDTAEYHKLSMLVKQRGGKMLVTIGQYLNTHHIPNWYPKLREFTPETFVIDNMWLNNGCDLVAELRRLGWKRFFIKDFVKSLKTHGGSIVNTPEDAPLVVGLMEKYRGTIEGGLCIRRFESLYNEQRYFVVNKHVWTPIYREGDYTLLDVVKERIDSPFYSVDIALTDEGIPRVVEVGDGQVSDLVGAWTPEFFSTIFRDLEGLTDDGPASNFCSTLNANVNNEKLTDAEFREFVRNSLPIVDFPRPKVVPPTDHSACKFVAKGR